jgi:hypothetical protein
MSLLAQQILIGRCLRATKKDALGALCAAETQQIDRDHAQLTAAVDLIQSPGFCFTRRAQRSWCTARSEAAAQLTLSVLTAEQRRQLVEDWVASGGGTAFDPESEADAFLEYLEPRLRDPSHELTICRMERAAQRAIAAAGRFVPPDIALLDRPHAILCAGKDAALVPFRADPDQLFDAIAAKQPLPPISDRCFPILFAPGLPNLFRAAVADEAALWTRLVAPVAAAELLRSRFSHWVINELFRIGAVDLAD